MKIEIRVINERIELILSPETKIEQTVIDAMGAHAERGKLVEFKRDEQSGAVTIGMD